MGIIVACEQEGSRPQGLGFRTQDLQFRVWDVGFELTFGEPSYPHAVGTEERIVRFGKRSGTAKSFSGKVVVFCALVLKISGKDPYMNP